MDLGWVYFADVERKKMNAIIDKLDEEDALDEIGIGTVRDAFSNILFPGTSVLQTRAKYFVLIPYIFQEAIKKGSFKNKNDVKKFINVKEDEIVKTLIDNSSKDEHGIIGKNKKVKNKPSSIFWNGLRASEILKDPGYSLDVAFEHVYQQVSNNKMIQGNLSKESKDDGGDDQDVGRASPIFDPISDDEFTDKMSITLTRNEADYLYRHFTTSDKMKDSLLAEMLKNENNAYFKEKEGVFAEKYKEFINIKYKGKNANTKKVLQLAKDFSDFVYGARLLYYEIFAEINNSAEAKEIENAFDEWIDNFEAFDIDSIINATNCKKDTATFLRKWNNICIECKGNKGKIEDAKDIIIKRERHLKRGREKLKPNSGYKFDKKLKDISGLTYRYEVVKSHCKEILNSR